MSEQAKKVLIGIVAAIVFVVCVALVVIGQKNVGPKGLGTMLIGLAGLITLLGLYNKQYK